MVRVSDVVEGVRESHLYGLQLAVIGLSTVLLFKVKFLEYVESHEGDDSLTVRRDFADLVASVIHLNGLHPFGLELRKILIAEKSAEFPAVGVDLLRNVAGIESVRAGGSDGLEGFGMVRERAPEKNFKSRIAEKFSFCNTLKIKTVKVLYFDEKRKNMQERNGQIHSH